MHYTKIHGNFLLIMREEAHNYLELALVMEKPVLSKTLSGF